jgi:hypothetical protein
MKCARSFVSKYQMPVGILNEAFRKLELYSGNCVRFQISY